MSFQAYHDITCSRARHSIVLKAIHAWFSENHFKRVDTGSEFMLLAQKGSHWGLSDRSRIRQIEILVRPEFGLTVVSVYHCTHRMGFIVGLMNTDILQKECDSLLDNINALPPCE
jgi:hypothetical protein